MDIAEIKYKIQIYNQLIILSKDGDKKDFWKYMKKRLERKLKWK